MNNVAHCERNYLTRLSIHAFLFIYIFFILKIIVIDVLNHLENIILQVSSNISNSKKLLIKLSSKFNHTCLRNSSWLGFWPLKMQSQRANKF